MTHTHTAFFHSISPYARRSDARDVRRLKDEMATEFKHSDGDSPVEIKGRGPLYKIDRELLNLGGDCIKVMQLLKADSSLLKHRALEVLHLGVSRGCVAIVEQVVKFYKGEGTLSDTSERGMEKDEQGEETSAQDKSDASSANKGEDKGADILGARTEKDKQGVQSSREEEIIGGNEDAPSVALDERPTELFSVFKLRLSSMHIDNDNHNDNDNDSLASKHARAFDDLLRAKYFYSGPDRELGAPAVAVINGNLDVLALLLTKTPSASLPERDPRNQLRKITEGVVESIKRDSVCLRMCRSVFDAWRNDPEFNFLFWDFDLGQERVSEYLFHFLFTKRCQETWSAPSRNVEVFQWYLWEKVWRVKDQSLWKSLWQLHDAQGRTPLHVAVDEDTVQSFLALLGNLPRSDAVKVFEVAMESTDGLGRTPWHRAVLLGNASNAARDLSRLFRYLSVRKVRAPEIFDGSAIAVCLWYHPMIDPVARLHVDDTLRNFVGITNDFDEERNLSATIPLHSAVMQGSTSVFFRSSVEAFSPRDTLFQCSVEEFGPCSLDALELATLTGNVATAELLLKVKLSAKPLSTPCSWLATWLPRLADDPMLGARLLIAKVVVFIAHSISPLPKTRGINYGYGWVVGDWVWDDLGDRLRWPTIHLAASSGNYEMLKTFLDSRICDPYIEDDDKRTVLHAVMDPKTIRIKGHLLDFTNVKHIPRNYVGPPAHECTNVERQGCINLLLQSGCDIFKVDKNGQAPYPKGNLSQDKEFLSWWYDRQLKEFNSNQNAMSFATNAISVMATLVATASYVGPLQPPLGYSSGDGPNQIQAKYIWVKIFIVCDTLSFYLAIAAITFSLIPSLPMPQQPMAAELEKTRGMIIWAVATLFPSIVCILLAFAAGSIVVISANGISSLGGNLTIITGCIGGAICLIGFVFLFIRLLGILFPRIRLVRRMYDLTSIFFQGRKVTFNS